jgi:WD40 repeat protein
MSVGWTSRDGSVSRVGRRSFLLGTAGAGAVAMFPREAWASTLEQSTIPARSRPDWRATPATGTQPVPPALRSRWALLDAQQQGVSTLPLTQNGTTYNLAQVVRWLDGSSFAVGRWDGTMSIFEFETAPFVGPLVTAAVNTPSSQGVQMITSLPSMTLATSNDSGSILLWATPTGNWKDLRLRATVSYDPSLGVATSGAWLPVGRPSTLAVGHDSGYLSLWSFDPVKRALKLGKVVGIQNPNPVNPFGSHVVYGLCPLLSSGPDATVVAGSDDGYVSIVRVLSGAVLSQTVFNPSAQRGINSVSASGDRLLVANCSVGAEDHNLWYFSVDLSTWALTLLDSINLIIDPTEIQSFNFDTIWGQYSGGPCWFAGTEEGALWMGTADSTLHLIGYEGLADGAIGAALDYTSGPGRLAAVIHNLDQFTTGAP